MRGSLTVLKNELMLMHQLHNFHLLYVLKYFLNTPALSARTALLKNPLKKKTKNSQWSLWARPTV